jgi:hypothetical protein
VTDAARQLEDVFKTVGLPPYT